MRKYRFRREIFDFDEDGRTALFDWPMDGRAGIECARGLYRETAPFSPCVEVIWRESIEVDE